ncbi:MAG: type II CAAX endopeptidase family protein [Chloroflexota bacterium]
MTTPFLDLPKTGKSEPQQFALGIFVILFCWFILGSLPYQLLISQISSDNNPATLIDPSTGLPIGVQPLLVFVVSNMSFWFLILGIFVAVRFVHQRPFLSLITPTRKMSWARVWQGFGVYFFLLAVATGIEYLLMPENFTFSLNITAFLPFLLVMLLLIPIQTSAEELLFRGYLLQATGIGIKSHWILATINGILFMVPHLGNPEVTDNPVLLPLFFFVIGAFLTIVTLRDNRLELALGVHAANNLFAGIVVNYSNSVLQTESIFLLNELNAAYSVGTLLVTSIIFYAWLTPKNQINGRTEFEEELG